MSIPAYGQAQNSDGPAWCGTAWACNTVGLTGQPGQGEFAGLALGGAAKVGVATGQMSADAAESLALAKCAASNANQPCLLSKSTPGCIGLADVPGGDVTSWDDPKATRVDAWTQSLKACGATGCRVEMTACARDDSRTASPFPLPPDVKGGRVDPAVVGTWEIPMNPGRWVWEIAANGTYEFHTEAPDGAPSHAGTFVANGGTWTLVSVAGYVDTDGGTYLMQGPNTMVMTGKLGTGSWQRITIAASAMPAEK
ncbi:MAG TPA: DUF4189 domain-containing protein [Stellaceae bacterium]